MEVMNKTGMAPVILLVLKSCKIVFSCRTDLSISNRGSDPERWYGFVEWLPVDYWLQEA